MHLQSCIPSIWGKKEKFIMAITRKSVMVLWMFETLMSTGVLKKDEALQKEDISDISFKRYIATLRLYLQAYHPSWHLAYKKSETCYRLFRAQAL
jgi:hypothetical protein